MILLFYFLLFIIGTAVGSFLGVVVDRALGSEAFWKGRSHCDHCRHKLHWNDLIPVLSYFLLGRKCRYCHKELSLTYPLIEIVTGFVFALTPFALFGLQPLFFYNTNYLFVLAYYYAVLSALIAIVFTDIKYGIIPFKVVVFTVAATVIWYLLLPSLYFLPGELNALGVPTFFLNSLAAGVGSFTFFFILFAVTKGRGMGFGDVIYAFLMGFLLGFPKVILGLYIAFVTGAIIALVLIVMKKKKFKGGTIPFGPFLALGTAISMLWGDHLLRLILNYFAL